MWTYNYPSYLEHHGILGQKWGRRNGPPYPLAGTQKSSAEKSSGRKIVASGSESKKKKRRTPDKVQRDERKKALKKRRTMSDAEIRKRIERMKLEREFKSLTEADIKPGRTAVKNVLGSSGKKVATTAAVGAATYGLKAILSKKFDIKEFANYAFPKPKNK